ncbi:MAG: ATP-dependent RNA helicase HrpA, partial [Planctomycetota bacterium]|nr:ATP-dependent RNA helicase HrpA [Planctomycetota bacterium]
MNGSPSIPELAENIEVCLLQDRRRFRRRLRRLKGRGDAKIRDRGLRKLQAQINESMEQVDLRRQRLVPQTFTGDLPILDARASLAKAIQDHPVIIVCGETGSGKTTQLPRICVDLGRGLFGLIGHTQPRRLAARAVAQRISEEMGSDSGVGYQVRFRRDVSSETVIKVMTDGILLAELSHDPQLEHYDTIIIDEAHERSLNIDLLLGCLKRISERRPELRVIVTSATIDAERFADFFDGAPVIEVSGRQFPVDIVHAESGDSPEDPDSVSTRVRTAMDQVLDRHPREGDVLIFLPGEREIREVSRTLEGPFGHTFEIVPLYARLSLGAQQKALRPGQRRRIVLATNVAETSLTVPRIRVVIDSGLARINRYSARRGVERLPVEGVSRASANQRAGRAGRLAPGTCLRLYSESAFNRRDEFTAPEIMRTNLASLILRLADLGLGTIEDFPLLDRPRPAAIRAGMDTLFELGALDDHGALTSLGRSMARLPVDPRVARMLLAGLEEECLGDVLIIASALAVPDPRLRPPGEEQVADQRHAAFQVEGSDFLSLRVLWQDWVKTIRSASSRRRWCKSNYLSWIRMREWREIHDQLHRMLRESGIRAGRERGDDDAVHRALLSGLVTNIGNLARPRLESGGAAKIEKGVYEGPDHRRFR